MVWRVASITLLLAVTGWAQAPGDVQQAVPLRSPFANPLRAAVKPAGHAREQGGSAETGGGQACESAVRQAAAGQRRRRTRYHPPAKEKPGHGQSRGRRARPVYQPDFDGFGGSRCLHLGRQALSDDRQDPAEGCGPVRVGLYRGGGQCGESRVFPARKRSAHEWLRGADHEQYDYVQGNKQGPDRPSTAREVTDAERTGRLAGGDARMRDGATW